ncbi:hypothetical protein KJ705_05245 [Patescibacteria group bacterium]|nr:hypothetical protein [Patescibacteria group bacterium]
MKKSKQEFVRGSIVEDEPVIRVEEDENQAPESVELATEPSEAELILKLEKNGLSQKRLEELLSDTERANMQALMEGEIQLTPETENVIEKIGDKIENLFRRAMDNTSRTEKIAIASMPASVLGGAFGGLLFGAPAGLVGGMIVGQGAGQTFFRGVLRLTKIIKQSDELRREKA